MAPSYLDYADRAHAYLARQREAASWRCKRGATKLPDLNALLAFHKKNNKIATVTAAQLDARFGGMEVVKSGEVTSFREKTKDEGKWMNAGFYVLKPEVFGYLDGDMDDIMWEDAPLENITAAGQLSAYRHTGFWKYMDALRDKLELENLWQNDKAKWKML